MEFRKPKPKKHSAPKKKPLPCDHQIIGIFNGQFVTVHDFDSMLYLYEAGNFGKGSLSKGEPSHYTRTDDIPKIMLEYEFENQAKWNDSTCSSRKPSGIVTRDYKLSIHSVRNFLESSFNDIRETCRKSNKEMFNKGEVSLLEFKADDPEYKDEAFINFVNNILKSRQIKMPKLSTPNQEVIVLSTSMDTSPVDGSARLERLTFAPEETLNLNLEEAFYLKSVLGCLRVVDLNSSEMEIPDLWEKFNSVDERFTERYLTYSHYRSKGWVVRSGLKFGGDFLLYKDGPAYYHGSYLVKVLDGKKKLTWRELVAMNRLVETFNKDLLLSHVLHNQETNEKESYEDALSNRSVQEVLVRRWIPTKERLSKTSK